ncbi:divergent protein kinase domain 1B-like isoform X2 [Heptranchias perlo]|uniref:divergent protein kinase domain 1B-like isoform X2 n=1 Tax=Heptranchias perlo TaxID=212740 RepID=UPI00355A9FBF
MRRARGLLHLVLFCPFSRGLQKRLPGVKVKYLFLMWLAILLGSWVLYVHYSSYSELCQGHICQMIICDRYKKGIISGSACKDLCEENTLLFQQCLSSNPMHQVYGGVWRNKEVIIKCGIEEAFRADLSPDTIPRRELVLFDKPTRGTSMDEFKEMLLTFLKSSLGDQRSLGNLVSRIISMADINQDKKISLAEAKSIWALLQLTEFLLIVSLHEKDHIPKLLGYCGDLYITEKIPYHSLYSVKVPRFLEAILPSIVHKSLNRWFAPAWPHRAKITIGLLEFVEEIFHGTYGSFYICDTDPRNIGYNENYDFKMVNFRKVMTEMTLKGFYKGRHCEHNTDCTHGKDCTATCDKLVKQCNAELIQPNLAKICGLLQEYLLYGAPTDFRDELQKHLQICKTLSGLATQMETQPSNRTSSNE